MNIAEVKGVPVWHPSVRFFEVRDANGSLLGSFYADMFPARKQARRRLDSELSCPAHPSPAATVPLSERAEISASPCPENRRCSALPR